MMLSEKLIRESEAVLCERRSFGNRNSNGNIKVEVNIAKTRNQKDNKSRIQQYVLLDVGGERFLGWRVKEEAI